LARIFESIKTARAQLQNFARMPSPKPAGNSLHF
jgi:hypothetical protein